MGADKVRLYESVGQKMAKIYPHELSSFEPPKLERYPFMGKDDNSLDKYSLEDKNNWVRYRKTQQDLIKKGYSFIQEKIKEISQIFLRQ